MGGCGPAASRVWLRVIEALVLQMNFAGYCWGLGDSLRDDIVRIVFPKPSEEQPECSVTLAQGYNIDLRARVQG